MKSIKYIALSIVLTLSAFCAVLYTSCTKDNCGAVTCLNKGTCKGGMCSCITGIGGANCETVYRKLYANNYVGTSSASPDSSTLVFTADDADTADFHTMHVSAYVDSNQQLTSMAIKLDTNYATSSTFVITPFNVGIVNYTGGGTLSATSASMYVRMTDTSGVLGTIQYNNFYRRK